MITYASYNPPQYPVTVLWARLKAARCALEPQDWASRILKHSFLNLIAEAVSVILSHVALELSNEKGLHLPGKEGWEEEQNSMVENGSTFTTR